MELKATRRRLLVGLRNGNWRPVYYEPIDPSEDLTKKDLSPDIGLYSRSHGDAEDGDPMLGEVIFLPLFIEAHFESKAAPEKKLMQRKLLYDAWRYLMASDEAQVEIIRAQLEDPMSSARQKALLNQMQNCKKRKTRRARQRRQRQIAKGQPVQSIEGMDDSGTDDDGYETDERGSMAPPPPPSSSVRNGSTGSSDRFDRRPSSSEGTGLFVSGVRGDPLGAEGGDGSRATSTNHSNALYGGRLDLVRNKRRNSRGSQLNRNTRVRTSTGLSSTGQRQQQSQERDDEISNEEDNLAELEEALRASRAETIERGQSFSDINGQLDQQAALEEAIRRSMPPE